MEGEGYEALWENLSDMLSSFEITKTSQDLSELEETLNYSFNRRQVLQEALTHSSVIVRCSKLLKNLGISPSQYLKSKGIGSYERLEFLGDAVLGQVITSYLYTTYPELDPGTLSRLRSENVRNENLARIAIRHGLYKHLRFDCQYLHDMIKKFVQEIERKPNSFLGDSRVPKILADVVESIVGAVFVDTGHCTEKVWEVFEPLLQPLVNLDTIEMDPVSNLLEFCQKQGKGLDYRTSRKDNMVIMEVYVDGQRVGRAENQRKKLAKRAAAKNAYENLKVSFNHSSLKENHKPLPDNVREKSDGAVGQQAQRLRRE